MRTNVILRGDCEKLLGKMPAASVDLIITSPPYGDARKGKYAGIAPTKYVAWFLKRSAQFYRVLKKNGTFILNIKEAAMDGERQTYVLELIIKLREQGWIWTEEFVWHKRNSFPGKWPNRFRDGWERLLQFNKAKKFKMYQSTVMVPIGSWAAERLQNLSARDKTRDHSTLNGEFGVNLTNWIHRKKAYPDNVLHLPTACQNNGHPASFPVALPEWFIRLFTKKGNIVLDPFVGSGVTAIAANRLERKYIGIDIRGEFCAVARRRIAASERKAMKRSSTEKIKTSRKVRRQRGRSLRRK